MFSFELSLIDIAIMIALGILVFLFLSEKRAQPTNKSESPTEGQKELPDKPSVTQKWIRKIFHKATNG